LLLIATGLQLLQIHIGKLILQRLLGVKRIRTVNIIYQTKKLKLNQMTNDKHNSKKKIEEVEKTAIGYDRIFSAFILGITTSMESSRHSKDDDQDS
jgi:hypothetical protein